MRLTLRTLLAYLDDTLEPEQAKAIGEKVAQSDIAPELIERIKRVTRRRGLAAPPVTGGDDDYATDPNTVAEYLDNELQADQLGEVEQSALDSDAYLAEISACHQILTLVLSEPARVPPTARQRMYRVVKGRESIPYRKTAATNNVAGFADPTLPEENAEADEALLLGMTSRRLLLPVLCGLVTMLLLAGVIYLAIPAAKPATTQGYVSLASYLPDAKGAGTEGDSSKQVDNGKKPECKKNPRKPDEVAKGPETLTVEPRVVDAGPPIEPKQIVGPPENPDPERKAIAKLETKDMVLLQRFRDTDNWVRAAPGKDLFSADTLMALPGNRCEVRLDSGLRLALWGSLPQYHAIPVLDILESRVTLHVPPPGFSGDFTLQSGRVFLTAPAGKFSAPPKVRIRFKEEIWDVTLLDPDCEICLDLLGFYPEGVPFSKDPGGPAPLSELTFGLLKGRADLRVKFKDYPKLAAPTRLGWDSASGKVSDPEKVEPKMMEWWNKTIPDHEAGKQMQAAVASFANRLSKPDSTKIEVIFFSAMEDPMEQLNRRIYSIYALQALDATTYLADAMSDDVPPIRGIGVRAVEHWCGQSPERDLKFFTLLMEKKSYTEQQATAVMQLTHPLSPADRMRPEIVAALFDALRHEKVAIRELAYQHLSTSDPVGAGEIGPFDVAADMKIVDAAVQKWKASWKKRFVDKK